MTATSFEESLIDFKCPHCDAALSFPEFRVGTAQECPFCFKIVVVPARGSGLGRKLPLPITTSRLRLRQLTTEDQPDWLEIVTDEESYKYMNGDCPDEGEARAWFLRSQAIRLTDPEGYILIGIEAQEPMKVVGWVSFFLYSHDDDPEMHRQGGFEIMMHRDHRRRGYATEAVRGLLNFAFTGVGLHDVRVSMDQRNIAARRVAEMAAMILEGEFAEDRYVKGNWVSTAWFRLLQREYERS